MQKVDFLYDAKKSNLEVCRFSGPGKFPGNYLLLRCVYYDVGPVIYDVREERGLLCGATGAFETKHLHGLWCCSGQCEILFMRILNPKKVPSQFY